MSSRRGPWTVMEILRRTSAYFLGKGVSEPRASAEVLLAHTLGLSRLDLYLKHDQPLTPEELARYRALVKRRAASEPVAYLTGHKEFWSLDFKVTPAVLIPRPETEVLVEAVLEVLRGGGQGPKAPALETAFPHPLWGLEVGVGSGAIVTVLAKELPGMTWTALDLSWGALEIARDNARRHGVSGRIHFLQGDLFSGLKPGPRFTLMVANLPYVSEADWQNLPPDIRQFEPRKALVGGVDGLALLSPMARQAHHYLLPGGWLALEVGEGQAETIIEVLQRVGAYDRLELRKDYQGINRVVRAHRRQPA